VFALVWASAAAWAYDQQISSQLWAEGYSVPARDGSWIRRRRLVEELRLGAWNLLPGSDDPYYRGPHLSIQLALRLDTDFAVNEAERNPGDEASYVPGVTPLQMDALTALVDVRGLWNQTLDLTAGRQIHLDTLGFFAFDGVTTRLHFPFGSSLTTYLGYEVRGGNVLGYDDLELDGTDSGGRKQLERDRYPDRREPERRLAVGGEIGISPWTWVDAGVGFRTVGLSGPLADERVGGRLTLGGTPLLVDSRVVASLLVAELTEAETVLAVTPWQWLTVAAEYRLYRPVFEGDSIFNVFDLAPQNDAGGRIDLRLTEALSLAGWGFARLAPGSAGIEGEDDDAVVAGAGGGLGSAFRSPVRELALRLSGVQEWGEKRLGGEIGGAHGFWHRRLWLGVRVALWHVDDNFSERLSGTTGGYLASLRYRLTKGATVRAEFEQYVGGGLTGDSRFAALVFLDLDLWR
jgi:hypothetical protein